MSLEGDFSTDVVCLDVDTMCEESTLTTPITLTPTVRLCSLKPDQFSERESKLSKVASAFLSECRY